MLSHQYSHVRWSDARRLLLAYQIYAEAITVFGDLIQSRMARQILPAAKNKVTPSNLIEIDGPFMSVALLRCVLPPQCCRRSLSLAHLPPVHREGRHIYGPERMDCHIRHLPAIPLAGDVYTGMTDTCEAIASFCNLSRNLYRLLFVFHSGNTPHDCAAYNHNLMCYHLVYWLNIDGSVCLAITATQFQRSQVHQLLCCRHVARLLYYRHRCVILYTQQGS